MYMIEEEEEKEVWRIEELYGRGVRSWRCSGAVRREGARDFNGESDSKGR